MGIYGELLEGSFLDSYNIASRVHWNNLLFAS